MLLLFATTAAMGQLQANFTVDRQGGCSPLNVRFTNTTANASPAAAWSWNFGNGNISALKDPGASYFDEHDYTVTLTVTDGANTSSKSMVITVYKKPAVDFALSPATGCVPLNVNLTATASAGDGSISNYFWDFGDGSTVQGPGYGNTVHSYTFAQNFSVTLNVTNSHGCYSTLTKNDAVVTSVGIAPVFTSSTRLLCSTGEPVGFTNASTGSGTLTYSWNFGDGTALSTDAAPVHVYAAAGTFTPALTVTSSDGCSGSITGMPINVANFKADFTEPAKICENQQAVFTNTSTRPFDRAEWYLDDVQVFGYFSGDLPNFFYQPGPHSLKLVTHYGNCTVDTTKTVIVYPTPVVRGFVEQSGGICGVPVTFNFTDTCSTAVSWSWQVGGTSAPPFATTQQAAYTFTSGSGNPVYLTVANAAGCSTLAVKYINYAVPAISIYLTNGSPYQGCTGLTASFAATPDTAIKKYQWNFQDGSPIDTTATPVHSFNVAGSFSVALEYVTNSGCTGTVHYNIEVVDKPTFNFTSIPLTTVCGNNPVSFSATPVTAGWSYYWYYNDTLFGYYSSPTSIIKFQYDTTYSMVLVAVKGNCRDTVTKINYITVLPPFPHIDQHLHTCDGTRGDVRFTETSLKAVLWNWDFRDGNTETYSVFKDTIRHTYTASGAYKVVLSTTNGSCTVKDSIDTYVLLKQHPLLTSAQNTTCGSNPVPFHLAGFERNPFPLNTVFSEYDIEKTEYGDYTTCDAYPQLAVAYWQTSVDFTLAPLKPGKQDIRVITSSLYFNCADTSNFVPLVIHGPTAGFRRLPYSGCFKDAMGFADTSLSFNNVAIVKWEWDFGDGQTQTLTSAGSTTHLYDSPGDFYVSLKVTDANGCTSQTNYGYSVSAGGPKADFSASAYTVYAGTLVYFYNNSNYANSYPYGSHKWIFSDGTVSTDNYPTFYYDSAGSFTVLLVTYNSLTGCSDTASKLITVRKVNSAFTFNLTYINSNLCPPVIASFTSISTNSVRLAWDFGDGAVGGNQRVVSHTYNSSGIYRVVHYSYDANNNADSTEDFIEVKGPYALLKADTLFSCSSLRVTLTAEVRNAATFTWDFGDGTVIPTTDTFAIHNYLTPGIYIPSLILKDAGGCTATSSLADKIVIDSLSVLFSVAPAVICDSANSIFTPRVTSLSNAGLQTPLYYTWITNELTISDTTHTATGNYFFTKIGTHPVSLSVSSPYGCQQTLHKVVTVKQGIKGTVTGAADICRGFSASFTGSAAPANTASQWKWDFANGNSPSLQNPPAQFYNVAGLQQIKLVVSNGSCADTVYHALMVNDNPVISIVPADPVVCKGSNIILTASGGTGYQWTSAGALLNQANAAATVGPVNDVLYFVKVTSAAGCSSRDSVMVKVIAPLSVTLPQNTFACEGSGVQLQATGAATYKWINITAGLSNMNIGNPVATPANAAVYTVVGYDSYHCFTDTATINVRVSQLPLVDAGSSLELTGGATVTLTPTVSGAVSWVWSPAAYLNCTACLTPQSKPLSSTTYRLTAYNADGCKASDVVTLRLLCKDNLVFIPNAFSPNGDGKNDYFNITGSGVKNIRSVLIYNRWGKVIFERKNIAVNDISNSWDGTYNGEPLPTGAYVYWISTECEGGDVFNYRGNVMIVR